jgi:hypothetical protein
MGAGLRRVKPGMTTPEQGVAPEAAWADEIRAYLLGRLSKAIDSKRIPRQHPEFLRSAPARRWWIFEGKRYGHLQGPLHLNFPTIQRQLSQLLTTFHPATRVSERPEANIDWARTLARGPRLGKPEFVLQSSRVGISEDERVTVLGWWEWLRKEWEAYRKSVNLPTAPVLAPLPQAWATRPLQTERAALRRWAHVARRSRWPVLRDVVAESLRVVLEPQALDQLPLPRDPAVLFELLVLVRVARTIAPSPEDVRWLDLETNNSVQIGELCLRVQKSFRKEDVLESAAYAPELARAITTFGVAVPTRTDILVTLPGPGLGGIRNILIETKSGSRPFSHAVEQLRVYRAAHRQEGATQRLLVWGVTETGAKMRDTQKQWLRDECTCRDGDVWLFSTADDVEDVVRTIVGAPIADTRANAT